MPAGKWACLACYDGVFIIGRGRGGGGSRGLLLVVATDSCAAIHGLKTWSISSSVY